MTQTRRASALLAVAAILPCAACILLNPDFDEADAEGATSASTGAGSASAPTATTPTMGSASSESTTDPTGATEATSGTTEATSGTTESTSGSNTDTDSSGTSSSSSGVDSNSDSSTSMGDPVCGDGSLDPGEECDDGNLDAGDACSPLCHVPPTGIKLEGESMTESAGIAKLTDKAECGSSTVLLKLDGRLDPMKWHCRPSYSCGGLTLGADLSVTTQVNATIGPFGLPCFEPSTSWELPCAPGHALVGFSGRSGAVIDKLQPRCAPIEIHENADGFTIITGTTVDLEAVGGDGGEPFGPHDCPANAVAVSASLGAGSWLTALQLTCKTLALSFD